MAYLGSYDPTGIYFLYSCLPKQDVAGLVFFFKSHFIGNYVVTIIFNSCGVFIILAGLPIKARKSTLFCYKTVVDYPSRIICAKSTEKLDRLTLLSYPRK